MRDAAIRRWRAALEQLALDRSTVDELVDHFASIVDERLAAGDEPDGAVAAARARLGEPAAIAREHARVRSSFGPTPSRLAATAAALAAVAASLISPTDGGLGLDDFVSGPAALRTAAILALLVFRAPLAAAYLFGATLCELGLWLANGLHTGVLDGDPRSTALLVVLVGSCVVLAPRRPTRWYIATAALAWTITLAALFGHPLGAMAAKVVIPLLGVAALLAIGLRLRIAVAACALYCLVFVAPAIAPAIDFVRTWPDVESWWRHDAVSWYAMQLVARLHAIATLAAPIVATLVLRGGGRPMRAAVAELRRV